MKRSIQMKKYFSMAIAIVLFVSLFSVSAMAAPKTGESGSYIIGNKDNIHNYAPVLVTEEDMIISEDVAYYIAEFFVRDMMATKQTCRDAKTAIINNVVMYDETGEDIVAYTFELTNGYVVVSAYLDVPQIILEWSDKALPVYESFDLGADDVIVYAGTLDYLLDDGGLELQTVDGFEVARSDVTNELMESRSIDNVRDDLIADIIEVKQANVPNPGTMTTNSNTIDSYITNPFTYATIVYGGTYTCSDSANNWESYASFATTTDFTSYINHCGPTAITNIIKMYGNKYNNSTIKNASISGVFSQVMIANNASGCAYYSASGGTIRSKVGNFIRDSFARYGISVSISAGCNASGESNYPVDYSNAKSVFSKTNALMYISLTNHACYGNHAVVGYAYTRLYIPNSTISAKSFVKVADGWGNYARYIDISFATASSHQYWEVDF